MNGGKFNLVLFVHLAGGDGFGVAPPLPEIAPEGILRLCLANCNVPGNALSAAYFSGTAKELSVAKSKQIQRATMPLSSIAASQIEMRRDAVTGRGTQFPHR